MIDTDDLATIARRSGFIALLALLAGVFFAFCLISSCLSTPAHAADLQLVYAGKCTGGNHVYWTLKVNGVNRGDTITTDLADLKAPTSTLRDADLDCQPVVMVLLREFVREYVAANPSATLTQIKNAVEAKTWKF